MGERENLRISRRPGPQDHPVLKTFYYSQAEDDLVGEVAKAESQRRKKKITKADIIRAAIAKEFPKLQVKATQARGINPRPDTHA